MKYLPALLCVATLCACASQVQRAGADNPAQVTQSINLSGFSPEYKRAFTAGCQAVSEPGVHRPKGSGADAQGWQDGFDYCKPRKPH